jgi:hypothetical protein
MIYARGITLTFLCLAVVVSAPSATANDWGTVKGQVVWGGSEVPTPKAIDAVKTHQDRVACEAKGPVVSEAWVINKENNGVRWAFVWLIPEQGQKLPVHPALEAIKEKQVVIDQPCCQFEPRAVGIRQGQEVVVKNSANVAHNVNWRGIRNPGNNLVIPAKGEPIVIKDLVPDRVKVSCNIHPWMTGWIGIFDHPYFTVTDADGKFEIKNAPAGGCRLVIWHEDGGFLGGAAGKNGQPIQIKMGGPTDVGKLELKP